MGTLVQIQPAIQTARNAMSYCANEVCRNWKSREFTLRVDLERFHQGTEIVHGGASSFCLHGEGFALGCLFRLLVHPLDLRDEESYRSLHGEVDYGDERQTVGFRNGKA